MAKAKRKVDNWLSFSVEVFIPSEYTPVKTDSQEEKDRKEAEDKKRRDDRKQEIINSIQEYRHVCRQILGLKFLAMCATAKVSYKQSALIYNDALVEKVGITKDQQASIKKILNQYKTKLKAVYDQTYQNPREVISAIESAAEAELSTILDAEQMKKWRDSKAIYFQSKPLNEETTKLLEDLFEVQESAHLYSMRRYILNYLAPSWMSATWDSARLAVHKVLKAKHNITKITAAWDYLQGNRILGRMNSVPISINKRSYHAEGHRIKLSWDHDIGEVELLVRKLDGSRHWLWKAFVAGRLNANQVGLTWKKTKRGPTLVIRISYEQPSKAYQQKEGRSMEVQFEEDGITMRMRDGKYVPARGMPVDDVRSFKLSYHAAILGVDQLKQQDEKILKYIRSCGSFYDCDHGEGVPQASQSLNNRRNKITVLRDRRVKDWNHRWTAKMVSTSELWKCEKIIVWDVPKNLKGRPWQWFQFKFDLEYKAKIKGVAVEFCKSVKASEVVDEVLGHQQGLNSGMDCREDSEESHPVPGDDDGQ